MLSACLAFWIYRIFSHIYMFQLKDLHDFYMFFQTM